MLRKERQEVTNLWNIKNTWQKFRTAIVSFVMSVRLSGFLSLRMEQFGSHWTDFHSKVHIWSIFLKIRRKNSSFIKI
jgi:hypothetical protein